MQSNDPQQAPCTAVCTAASAKSIEAGHGTSRQPDPTGGSSEATNTPSAIQCQLKRYTSVKISTDINFTSVNSNGRVSDSTPIQLCLDKHVPSSVGS
jgi:hypothetical protein